MEIARILIIAHASLGGIALFAGMIALIAKKGSDPHKRAGLVFFYSMLSSAVFALVISVYPKHESPFLFTIGIFSSYFLITGYRALKYKTDTINYTGDKLLAFLMLLTGICMIAYPIVLIGKLNIVLTVFGTFSIIQSIQDLRSYTKPEKLKKNWLKAHLGKMLGGYIAAITAFVVVNQFLPGVIGWLAPGLIGSIYIVYWTRKVSTK